MTASTKTVRTAKVVTASDVFTPYKAAKFVNSELEKAGLSKRIPPQMMYNYTTARVNAGKKPLIEYDEKSGNVDMTSLKKWLKAYIAKHSNVEETK